MPWCAHALPPPYGVTTYAEYCEHLDAKQTQHLGEGLEARVIATAGAQRRSVRSKIEDTSTVIVCVPIYDPHRKGVRLWAELDFCAYLDLLEGGALGAWQFRRKGRDRTDGQVVTKLTMCDAHTAIVRLIVNAKAGQQARTLDGNPLNLRRANCALRGNLATAEGRAVKSKYDAHALMLQQSEVRERAAGKGYEIPDAASTSTASASDAHQAHKAERMAA